MVKGLGVGNNDSKASPSTEEFFQLIPPALPNKYMIKKGLD